jgi:hypothetical protein
MSRFALFFVCVLPFPSSLFAERMNERCGWSNCLPAVGSSYQGLPDSRESILRPPPSADEHSKNI